MPRVRPLHPLRRRQPAPPTGERISFGTSTARRPGLDANRRQAWGARSPDQVLGLYPPGRTPALQVVDVLIELHNTQHTALEKTVSHKTRHERAQFLRRFFRDLAAEAGYKVAPDPRGLGQRHIHDMVQVWRRRHLAAATIQTYLSFLRGLAMWVGKPGLVLKPEQYGLTPEEYERHENARADRSWQGHGIDVEALLTDVAAYDSRIAASMRLMVTFGLRRKESVMCRPHAHLHPFAETGLADELKEAEQYLWVKGKGGRVRWLPVASEAQRAAIRKAQAVVQGFDAHLGDPGLDLKSNLRRLDHALAKFGLTKRALGTTGHGARHGFLQAQFEAETGKRAPVCGGGAVDPEVDRSARLRVSQWAGHSRLRAAGPYLGPAVVMRRNGCERTDRPIPRTSAGSDATTNDDRADPPDGEGVAVASAHPGRP